MASPVLNIILRLKAEGEATAAALRKELAALAAAQGKLGVTGVQGGQGLTALGRGATTVTGQMEGLVTSLKGAALGFAGLGVISVLKNLADTAARTQVLGTVLNVVALNAGYTNQEIAKVDKSVQAVGISSQASKTALTAFIQSGLDISKAGKLAAAAQDLAVIAGEDSSLVFQRLIVNIQQLDTLGLRYNGVVTDIASAERLFLQTNKDVVGELTTQQKQQALLNAVLDKAAAVAGAYEMAMGDVGKQLSSLKRLQQEASESAGNSLLPAYKVLVEEFTLFLKQSKLLTDSFNNQGSGAQKLADAIAPIASALRQLAVFVVENIDVISKLVIGYLALKGGAIVLGLLGSAAVSAANGVLFLFGKLQAVGSVIAGLAAGGIPAMISSLRALGVTLVAISAIPIVRALALVVAAGAAVAGAYVFMKNRADSARQAQDLLGNSAEGLKNRLTKLYFDQITQLEVIKEAQREYDRVKTQGDAAAIRNAEAKLKSDKEILKSLMAQSAEAERLARANGVDTDPLRGKAEENKRLEKMKKQVIEVTDALKKLGIASAEALDGKDISKEFSEDLSAAKKVLEDFDREMKETGRTTTVTAGALDLAFKKIGSSAKSVDELTASIDFFRSALGKAGSNKVLLNAQIDTAAFQRQKAVLTEVDTVLAGYLGRMAKVRETGALLTQIALEAAQFSSGLKVEFAQLGLGLEVAANGFVTVTNAMRTFGASEAEVARQRSQNIGQGTQVIVAQYRAELQAIRETAAAKRSIIDAQLAQDQARLVQERLAIQESIQGESQRVEALRAFDQQATGRRLDSVRKREDAVRAITQEANALTVAQGKKTLDELTKQQETYKTNVIAIAQKISDFNRELAGIAKDKAANEFDVKIAKANEYERVVLQNSRIEELRSQARKASAAGDIQSARDLNTEALALAKTVQNQAKSEFDSQLAVGKVNELYDERAKFVNKAKLDAEAAQALEVKALNQITAAKETLAAEIKKLAEVDTVTKIKFEVDPASLTGIREAVEKALKGIKFTLEGSATTTSVRGFADGGPIRGPGTGTSDSILMLGSNGEFMMKADAVQHWGEGFLHSLNQKRLPRFADGGRIGGSASSKAPERGSTLNLTINGRRAGPITGSRETLSALTNALKELQ